MENSMGILKKKKKKKTKNRTTIGSSSHSWTYISRKRKGICILSPWGCEESDTTEQLHFMFTFMHWRRKWQPTPVFLPRESQGRGSLVGCRLWGRIESTRLKWLSSSNNIPRATLTQWRKKGKSPSFSIPWWDCLTPQMASEGVREALTYAPLFVSLTLPLPPASPNHLPNKQPAPKALYQFLLYIMVLFQCL